jgi:roadblock/LC7 domain-containing protein
MISKTFDYDNFSGLSDVIVRGYANFTGTSGFVPYISFTATATGYSNTVIGVDGDDIDNIIGVDSADIDNVSGI